MRDSHTIAYDGDANLERLLRGAGVDADLHAIFDLIAGVNAAPITQTPDWVGLVTPNASAELTGQLTALREQLAPAPDAGWTRSRIDALRAQLKACEVDGFVIPRADEHQNEYVPARAERLLWSTGFSGSAGVAIVFTDRALVFVDGRYTLQIRDQVDLDVFEPLHLIDQPPHEWLAANLKPGQVLGIDPWMHTVNGAQRLQRAADRAGAELRPLETNPLDAAWTDQPPAPISPIIVQRLEHAGTSSADKRKALGDALDGDAVVLTTPDSIAWLLNVRGADVPHTPLPLSFAILFADGTVDLCVDPRKLAPGTRAHLGDDVRLFAADALGSRLARLADKTVQIDPNKAADHVRGRLQDAGATVTYGADPCALPKAVKNEAELEGTRAAHRRDGAALTRFLAWLDHNADRGLDELTCADRLHAFRLEDPTLRDLSFDTISGAAGNGAIVHYRVTEETNRTLEQGTLYLVDSGGQYPDGTTDVTRTVAIGTPTAEMRDRFTRVLKGHINLGTARFCQGTTGAQLDALARLPLWQAGIDYDHGTGHGVGSYLGVHEGPQRISKAHNTIALQPGMIVSNEPGYYKTGEYGIRIENLVVVQRESVDGGERDMLCFETLTLAPIDRRLIEPSLLTDAELDWVNAYHARVLETITPLLADEETKEWLARAAAPLSR